MLLLARVGKVGTILVGEPEDCSTSHGNALRAKGFLDVSLALRQDFHAQERFYKASACEIKIFLVKF